MKDRGETRAPARDLRKAISDLLQAPRPDRIVLAPGILVALRVLFSHLRIERILLTSEEYDGAGHFPGGTVEVAGCGAIPERVEACRRSDVVAGGPDPPPPGQPPLSPSSRG